MTEKMISISKEEIGNKMFFINEKDSNQPIVERSFSKNG